MLVNIRCEGQRRFRFELDCILTGTNYFLINLLQINYLIGLLVINADKTTLLLLLERLANHQNFCVPAQEDHKGNNLKKCFQKCVSSITNLFKNDFSTIILTK